MNQVIRTRTPKLLSRNLFFASFLIINHAPGLAFSDRNNLGELPESSGSNTELIVRILITCFTFVLVLYELNKSNINSGSQTYAPAVNIKKLWLYFVLIYTFVAVFSAIELTNSIGQLLENLYYLFEWIVLFSVAFAVARNVKYVENVETLERFFRQLIFLSCLLVVSVFIIYPELAFFSTSGGLGIRLGGYFMHPNQVGAMSGLGLTLMIFSSERRVKYKALMMLFFAAVLFLTASRTSIGSSAIAIYIVYILRSVQRKNWISLILSMFFLPILIVPLLGVATDQIFENLSRGQSVETLFTFNNRIYVWRGALDAFFDSPIIGHGLVVGPKIISEYIANYSLLENWVPPHAHNDTLNALIAGGIGFGAFILWASIYPLYKGWKVLKTRQSSLFLILGVITVIRAQMTLVMSGQVGEFQSLFVIALFCMLVMSVDKKELS